MGSSPDRQLVQNLTHSSVASVKPEGSARASTGDLRTLELTFPQSVATWGIIGDGSYLRGTEVL